MSWLAHFLARALDAGEREAVLGDLAERPQAAVRDVLGLVIRRQFQLWLTWRPWAILVLISLPFAFYLSLISKYAADGSAVILWLYLGRNWDLNLFSIPMFRHDIVQLFGELPLKFLHLVCWSWSLGLLLGRFFRRSLPSNAVLFSLALVAGGFTLDQYAVGRARVYSPNAEVFRDPFYRTDYPVLVLLLFGLLPAVAGMLHSHQIDSLRPALKKTVCIAALIPVFMVLTQASVYLVGRPRLQTDRLEKLDHAFTRVLRLLAGSLLDCPVNPTSTETSNRMRTLLLFLVASTLVTTAGLTTIRAPLQPKADRKPAQ